MKFLGISTIPTLFDGRYPWAYLEESGGSSVREWGDIDRGNYKVSPWKEIGKVQVKFTYEITKLLAHACLKHLLLMKALASIVSVVGLFVC